MQVRRLDVGVPVGADGRLRGAQELDMAVGAGERTEVALAEGDRSGIAPRFSGDMRIARIDEVTPSSDPPVIEAGRLDIAAIRRFHRSIRIEGTGALPPPALLLERCFPRKHNQIGGAGDVRQGRRRAYPGNRAVV